jgi:hypothetical protein
MRPVIIVVVGLTALALALGRGVPEATGVRYPATVRYQAINWYLFRQNDAAPRFLDAETGRLARVAFPGSGGLEYAACSPWFDERGESQVAGLWNDTAGKGGEHASLGLARYTFPGRQLLDCVPIDVIPNSHLCWYPETTPRVLFAATDGQLYSLAFAEPRADGASVSREPDRLQRVVWRCSPPGDGVTWISDPSWPADPRLGGRVLVALRTRAPLDSKGHCSRSGLWWLQLSPGGTHIEAAARLTTPDSDVEEHWPVLRPSHDGGLTLAYLVRRDGLSGLRLRLAAVTLDQKTGAPSAVRPLDLSPDPVCLPTPPVFSTDGRWIHVLADAAPTPVRVDRFSVDAILARDVAPAPPSHLAATHPLLSATTPRPN